MRRYVESGVVGRIREAGGEIFAISSEPQLLAGRARAEWELSFDTIGDPHHDITDTCRDRGWIDIYANTEEEFLDIPVEGMDVQATHPKGYFQPGVLVLDRHGRVLYRWRSVPTHANIGGALERPTPEYVWTQVELNLVDAAEQAADVDLDESPELDAKSPPWPIFVCALLGNGWFVRPIPFGYLLNGLSAEKRIQRALKRFAGFVISWVLAFVFLPALPVAIALAGWFAWIVPKVRMVNKNFQHVEA